MRIGQTAGRTAALTAMGMAALAVTSIGIARASGNNGIFVLGAVNHTTKPTTLSDRAGTPLVLKAGHHKAPLLVNSATKVKRLNADEVDGLSAGALKTSGSGVRSAYPEQTSFDLTDTPAAVASTGKLAAGTYYASASAVAFVASGDAAYCQLSTKPVIAFATTPQTMAFDNTATLAIAAPERVGAGQRLSLYCWSVVPVSGTVSLGYIGLTAVKVDRARPGSVAAGTVHP